MRKRPTIGHKAAYFKNVSTTGILYQGYTLAPKLVTRHADLTLAEKGLLLYFLSKAKNLDEFAEVTVDTICFELNVSSSTFHKYKQTLERKKLLEIRPNYFYVVNKENKRVRSHVNAYRVNSAVTSFYDKTLDYNPSLKSLINKHVDEKGPKKLNILDAGYGTLPNAVLTNPELSLGAKVLYAHLTTFTESMTPKTMEKKSFKSLVSATKSCLQLGITHKTYYRYINELVDSGLISRKNQTRACGRFAESVYELLVRTSENIAQKAKEARLAFNKFLREKRFSKKNASILDNQDQGKLPNTENTIERSTRQRNEEPISQNYRLYEKLINKAVSEFMKDRPHRNMEWIGKDPQKIIQSLVYQCSAENLNLTIEYVSNLIQRMYDKDDLMSFEKFFMSDARKHSKRIEMRAADKEIDNNVIVSKEDLPKVTLHNWLHPE